MLADKKNGTACNPTNLVALPVELPMGHGLVLPGGVLRLAAPCGWCKMPWHGMRVHSCSIARVRPQKEHGPHHLCAVWLPGLAALGLPQLCQAGVGGGGARAPHGEVERAAHFKGGELRVLQLAITLLGGVLKTKHIADKLPIITPAGFIGYGRGTQGLIFKFYFKLGGFMGG